MMNNDGEAQPEPAGEHAMFGVKGSCDMCKQRIETAAKSVNGVSSAHWDKENR